MFFLKRCPAQFAFVLENPLRRWLLQLDRLVASLPLAEGARVLDLGAGSGVVSEAVLGRMRGGRLVLMDAQARMIRRARRRLAAAPGEQVGFSVGVAEWLPFPDHSFDLVLMVTVLGEVDDTALTMREVHRVLRPGGTLSISEHLPDADFRAAPKVRALLPEFGFRETGLVGSRWSYTLNAATVSRPAS